MSVAEQSLKDLLEQIPLDPRFHRSTSAEFSQWRETARRSVEELLASSEPQPVEFGPFGPLVFPYFKMGQIDSLNLFDLHELILFAFYDRNRHRYRKVGDVGGNLGLHSLILARCGFQVETYEPDPVHFAQLHRNIELNGCQNQIHPHNVAVSVSQGRQTFVRVLGNTTGSHLQGAKSQVYGGAEEFSVETVAFRDILLASDLVKIDVEGHEKEILCATTSQDWDSVDAVVEVGTVANATAIYEHFRGLGVGLFSQKISWGKVENVSDMPESYKDGSLFISKREAMPWTL